MAKGQAHSSISYQLINTYIQPATLDFNFMQEFLLKLLQVVNVNKVLLYCQTFCACSEWKYRGIETQGNVRTWKFNAGKSLVLFLNQEKIKKKVIKVVLLLNFRLILGVDS